MLAPGISAPVGSETVPTIRPVVVCDHSAGTTKTQAIRSKAIPRDLVNLSLRIIDFLLIFFSTLHTKHSSGQSRPGVLRISLTPIPDAEKENLDVNCRKSRIAGSWRFP